MQLIRKTEARGTVQDQDHREFHVTDLTTNAIFAYEVLFILLVTYGLYNIFVSLYRWYNFHNLGFAQTQETLYKYLLFDKADLFLQLTSTFGARTVRIHLGTFFGNPEDIKITRKLSDTYPLELEHGYLIDIISFNWKSFLLNLRGMPLVLPLSTTLTGFNRILIRGIFESQNGMFKIIACNKANCHLTVLQPYTRIQNIPTTTNKSRKPTKPLRLNLTEPFYMCNGGEILRVTVKVGRRLKGHGFRSRREHLIPIQARLPTRCQLDGAILTILLCGLRYLGGVTSHSAGSYGGPCAALLDNSHVAGQLRSTISWLRRFRLTVGGRR